MSQIATVEMIYVAKSGRQYRARHKQVHTGWELEDLEQQAKSALSLRDYAIEFVNVNGHKQFVMPVDLETIIVNVVAITEERWEEPAYEELQKKWTNQIHQPYGQPEAKVEEPISAPDPVRVAATATALMVTRQQARPPKVDPTSLPGNEDTQSIKIKALWPNKPPVPQQRVNWPDPSNEETQPINVLKGEVAGMSIEDATQVIERVAAGGTVTPGSE